MCDQLTSFYILKMSTIINKDSPSLRETAAVVGSKDTRTKMKKKKFITTKKSTAYIITNIVQT